MSKIKEIIITILWIIWGFIIVIGTMDTINAILRYDLHLNVDHYVGGVLGIGLAGITIYYAVLGFNAQKKEIPKLRSEIRDLESQLFDYKSQLSKYEKKEKRGKKEG